MQGTIQEYTLDMADGTAQKPLIVKQGDTNSRQARITLKAFKEPWTIPFGCQIQINVRKNDGTYANATCTQEDEHTVLAPITEQMTAVPGTQLGELFFLGSDGDIRSQTFPLLVWDAVSDLDLMASSNDFRALKDSLRQVVISTEAAAIATQYATEQGNAARDAAQRANDAADSIQVAVDASKAAKVSETNAKASETAAAQTQQEVTDYVESQKAAFVGYSKRETDSQYANAIIKTATGAGRVDVDDAWTAPVIGLDVAGRSEQVQTTGAQLFDVDAWYNFFWNTKHDIFKETVDGRKCLKWRGNSGYTGDNEYHMFPVSVKPGTQYVIEFEGKMSAEGAAEGKSCTGIGVCYQDGTRSSLMCPVSPTWKKAQLVTSKDCTIESLYMPFNHALYCLFDIDSIKLYELGTVTPYEPYTGGKPAPSPAYPQQIVSTGTVGTGAQLLDVELIRDTSAGGIKFINNHDGSFSVTGTSTSTALTNQPVCNLTPGEYSVSGSQGGVRVYVQKRRDGTVSYYNNLSFSVTDADEVRVYLQVEPGTTVNAKVWPMLNAGNTALPWEPYTGGKPAPSAEYPQEMTVRATVAQLFDAESVKDLAANGIKFLNNHDGSISVSGTATAITPTNNIRYDLAPGSYYITGSQGDAMVYASVRNNGAPAYYSNQRFDVGEGDKVVVYLQVSTGKTVNAKVWPMLNSGEQPLPWEPYRTAAATITLTEPLRGIGEYRDRLGYRDGVWGIEGRSYEAVYDGSEDEAWYIQSVNDNGISNYMIALRFLTIGEAEISLCNRLLYDKSLIADATRDGFLLAATSTLYVRLKEVKTVADLRTWLADDPLIVVYPRATPTWTPLPDSAQQALNALTTFAGTTHLTITTGGTTPDVTLDYVQDTHKALEECRETAEKYTDNQLANIVAAMPVKVQAAIVDTQITTLLKEV